MFQWDDIRVFLALKKAGTQKAAAKILQVDQATVGRRIKEFEGALGTKLFDKRSDGFVLTEAGNQLLLKAQEAESLIGEMGRSAQALDQRPKGVIKIAMPGAMANHWLIPKLNPFFQKHPEIRLEFLTGPEVVNLWKREADVAIRLVAPTQKELFFKKIGEIRLAAYASKTFLFENKKIKPNEIRSLPFIGLFERSMSLAESSLLEKMELNGTVVCRSHAWSSVYYAVQSGIGFGILPSFFADKDKELVELTTLPSTKAFVWLVMHPDVKGSGRIKAFTNFLTQISS